MVLSEALVELLFGDGAALLVRVAGFAALAVADLADALRVFDAAVAILFARLEAFVVGAFMGVVLAGAVLTGGFALGADLVATLEALFALAGGAFTEGAAIARPALFLAAGAFEATAFWGAAFFAAAGRSGLAFTLGAGIATSLAAALVAAEGLVLRRFCFDFAGATGAVATGDAADATGAVCEGAALDAKSSSVAPRFFSACLSQAGRGPRPPQLAPVSGC